MEDNEKLKALHESLLKDNYELPSYEVFAEDLRSPEKSKAFYDGLAKDNYELPDYEVFVNDLGLKKKDIYESLGFGRDLVKELYGEESSTESKEPAPEVSKKPSPSELANFKFGTTEDAVKKALESPAPKQADLTTPDLSLKKTDGKFSFPNNDINDSLARAMLNVPVKEDEPEAKPIDYITALPQGFNQRMGQAIRDIGYTANLPKEALAHEVRKIGGKFGAANEQYLRQAFSAILGLGMLEQESWDQLATAVEGAGKPGAIPNNLIGGTLGSVGSILFDIMAVRTPPTSKLNVLAKYGMERVPMFPIFLGTMEGTTIAREGGNLGDVALSTGEGLASGLTYEGMGIAGGRVGQLVKELGGGQTLSTTSRALANSVLFGADSKLKGGTFMEGAAIGLVFGGYDMATEGISRSMAHRAYVSYLTATDNNIKTISKMQVDPMKMRKQSDELWTQYEAIEAPNVSNKDVQYALTQSQRELNDLNRRIEDPEFAEVKEFNIRERELLGKDPAQYWEEKQKHLDPEDIEYDIDQPYYEKMANITKAIKKQNLLEEKTAVDNIININAMTQEILKNPKAFTDAIAKDERLSPKEKALWTNKINTTVKDADPRLAEAEPIVADIKNKEGELAYWQENESVDPMIKDAKIESVNTQIEEQNKALQNTLAKPLDDYAPKKKKGKTTENESGDVKTKESSQEIKVGDKVINPSGEEVEVVALTETRSGKPALEVKTANKTDAELLDVAENTIWQRRSSLYKNTKEGYAEFLKDYDYQIKEEHNRLKEVESGKIATMIAPLSDFKINATEQKGEPVVESKLAVGEKQFKTKEELNTYLEDVAVNKKTGEVDETWFDREVNAWPTPETVKAINEWTENKKAEIKAKRKPEKEEPIETGLNKVEPKELDKNGLIDEIRRFNILSASGKKKAAVQANHIRVNAKRLGYELKEGDEWKVGIIKDGKFLGIRKDPAKPDKQKAEASKLLTERDKDFQDYMNDVLETNPNLFGVLIGGITNEQRAQAVKDIKAGKKSVASATALDALEYMYKDHGGIDIWNAEGETRVRVSRDEIRAEVEDMRRRKRDELFNTYNLDEALEKGLITKTEYDEIRESERKQDIESRAAEEDFYRDETGDIEGGKEKGTEGELTPKVNEQPVKQPDITTGKEGENIIPAGTEKDVTGVEGQGTKEPVSEPAKVETPQPQGIKFKDKNYTDIEQVQDDLAEGKITFDESKTLMEDVRGLDTPIEQKSKQRKKSMKKLGAEPLTEKPEELAWDQPLPISTREDPNFKHSDLNNAMSLRNVGRNLIRNVGMIEGMDQRTGMIGRFAKKARGLFNPTSGIIRVKGPKDIRALAHEIGHWIDHEIFDIRGIIGAIPPNKQLGSGVDFNGETYTSIREVEQAIRDKTLTLTEGNQLLPLVKKFESLKLKEKYSEVVEQTVAQGVKFKSKTYKSVKDINDAVAQGIISQAKANDLILKFNNLNKGLSKRIDAMNKKYGEDVVAGVMQRTILKKEFDSLLKDIGYPSKKRTEGIAEFIYNYIIDPGQLVNSTPNALVWFEKLLDNAPEIKKAMSSAREDWAKYDAQDIRTKLEAEQKTQEKEKTPFIEGITKIMDEFYYSAVNQLAPLKGTVDEWRKIIDDTYLPHKDPFLSAKAMIGIDGRAKVWLTHHPYFNRGEDIIFKKDVEGLLNIIKPIVNTPNYDSYKTYLLALDSLESHLKGKPEQAYYGKEEANAARLAYEKEYGVAKLWEFRDKIQKYNHALLDFYVESGRISKETADYWKKEHEYYVPLKRISEEYEKLKGEKAITRDLLPESEKAIFSRKGSQKQVKDIFESMIENTYHILQSGERNLLNKNVADMLFDIHNYNREHKKGAVIEEIDARDVKAVIDPTTGEVRYALTKERPANFKKPKGHILTVYEDGKPRFYDIAPEYYDSIFNTVIPQSMAAGKIMKILSLPSRWLQAGSVVYDPTFPVRNIARDQMSSLFYSKHGYHPGWFARGISDLMGKNDYYHKWLASGADQSFLVSADKMISEDFLSKKIGNLTRRKFDTYKRNPLALLQDFSMATEIGTRIGGFENAYKKTGSVRLAMQEARDIAADYGIKGAGVKSILPLYPFLNARTQHARMTISAFKDNPIPTMLKGMTFVTIPTLLNWLNNNKDEEAKRLYQGLPTWRRLSMFNVRIPGTDHFFPIPKGFFGTMFGASVESVLDAAVKDDPRALDKLLPELFQSISPVGNWSEFLPLIARPMVEDAVNMKGYTGKPIVSESLKLLPKSQQFYNSTPEIIKKMGEALNWSPVKIEHYIKSYTGGAGFGAVNILDETLQAAGIVDKKPEDTFTALSRLPLLKAILTERPVGLYSGHIADFYETMDKIEKTVFTVNNYIKKDDADGADKFLSEKGNDRMYSFYLGNSTAINSFRQSLSWVRDAGYAVMKDDLLTMPEKQAEIKRMNDIIHETALRFKDAYEKGEHFNYSKSMDEIIDRMKIERKEQRSSVGDQKLIYNPYWIQLKDQNRESYDLLKEFGGLREIEQNRKYTSGAGVKTDLDIEDVRRFNEEVVKNYGNLVKYSMSTSREYWKVMQETPGVPKQGEEQSALENQLDALWDQAFAQTKGTFTPMNQNK